MITQKPRLVTIIAGSRGIYGRAAFDFMWRAIDELPWTISEVVSGRARGVDTMGEFWAERRRIPIQRFAADWNEHGKSAGFKRNIAMAQHAEALLAIHDGVSPGTAHMVRVAREYGLPVVVRTYLGDGLDL